MSDLAATSATLSKTLLSAAGGDVVRLAPGTYSKVRVQGMRAKGAPVTIAAADPASPPRFSDGLTLDQWQDVTFQGIDFDISSAAADYASAVRIYGGRNLAFVGGRITGRKTATDRWGFGVQADSVQRLKIAGMACSTLRRGLVISMSDDVEVLDNDLVQLGTDGVNFGGVVRGTIARNRIEDFFPVNGDHPDGIQLMSPDATRQSADIRIVDNLVKAGAAAIGQVQGIFVKAENGRRYQRVEITGNLILQTGYHGICATSVDGIAVAGNEVVFQASKDGSPESWILIGDSTGRVVENRAMTLTANAPLLASGNTIRAKATEAEVQQAMSAWLARHRAPAKPEPKPEPEAEIRTITVKPGEKILIVGAA